MIEGHRTLQTGDALLPDGLSLVYVDQAAGTVSFVSIDKLALDVPIAEAAPRCLVPALAALREMSRRRGNR